MQFPDSVAVTVPGIIPAGSHIQIYRFSDLILHQFAAEIPESQHAVGFYYAQSAIMLAQCTELIHIVVFAWRGDKTAVMYYEFLAECGTSPGGRLIQFVRIIFVTKLPCPVSIVDECARIPPATETLVPFPSRNMVSCNIEMVKMVQTLSRICRLRKQDDRRIGFRRLLAAY